MNATVDPDSAIAAQARRWALAVVGEDFSPTRSAELASWLKADPRHPPAYEAAETTLSLLDEALLSPMSARIQRPRPLRWPWIGGAIAAGLAVAAILVTPPASLRSEPGQTRQIALADGSQVTLAPDSSLRPTWRWARRAYVLERGQAFFAVAHDPKNPFTVAADDTRIRVLGTRFDVHRLTEQRVRVEVEQGLVEVSREAADARRAVARVGAGQGAVADTAGVATAPLVDPTEAGGWRSGRLDYVAAPLADVVADLQRYGIKARVTPEAAKLEITAGLRANQGGAFVEGLPRVLPVSVTQERDGGLVIQRLAPRRPMR